MKVDKLFLIDIKSNRNKLVSNQALHNLVANRNKRTKKANNNKNCFMNDQQSINTKSGHKVKSGVVVNGRLIRGI